MLIRSPQRGEVAAPSAGKDRVQWPVQVLPEPLLLGREEEQGSAVASKYFCAVLRIW